MAEEAIGKMTRKTIFQMNYGLPSIMIAPVKSSLVRYHHRVEANILPVRKR
jgi:hypothetical protein